MSEKTYWYECQERAMAPGIADGWPEVIPAPHTPNGRLIRRECPTPVEAHEQNQKTVDRLPQLADGVPALWGDKAYAHIGRGVREGRVEIDDRGHARVRFAPVRRVNPFAPSTSVSPFESQPVFLPVIECFSTPDAASAGVEPAGGGA